jgi:NADH-ubiquinone oxidoreductase chain 5
MEQILVKLSKNLSTLDTGVVTSYALYLLIGFILYIASFIYFDPFIIIFTMFIVLLLFKGYNNEEKK